MRKVTPTSAACLRVAALAVMVQPVFAQPSGWGMSDDGHMWGGMGYGWGHGLVWLLLVVFGVLVYRLARRSDDGDSRRQSQDPSWTALQILNERYARGEIEKTEYDEKKASLLGVAQR